MKPCVTLLRTIRGKARGGICPLLSLLIALSSCAPTRAPIPPGTIPEAKAPSVSDEQYGHNVAQQLSEQYQVDYANPELNRIEEIVDRLTKAAKADAQQWHVVIFRDKLKNAAATRGNHIFIWTGMLESTKSDGELAAILGHEIGHVLAGHTAGDPQEEVKRILIQVVGMAAGVAASIATRTPQISGTVGDLASSLTGSIGEGLLINPHSRQNEFEADQIGLELMAEAKYDPNEAIEFWNRASKNPEFSSSFSILSTHPAAPDRLERLQKLLPYAEARYKGLSTTRPAPLATPVVQPPAVYGQQVDRDSFDLRDRPVIKPREFIPSQSPTLPQPSGERTEWKVVADRAVLFSAPRIDSRRIGEFRRGGVVVGSRTDNGWIQILRPDFGFLRVDDLAPIFLAPTSGK